MNSIKFVEVFNSIKPTINEILSTDSSISTEVAEELRNDYNLQLISLHHIDEPVLDLISNTNICKLYFSQIQLGPDLIFENELIKIGCVLEKADIYFNDKNKDIIIYLSSSVINDKSTITQNDFLLYWLKYLEIDFNKIFRRDKEYKYISQIVNISEMKTNHLFKTLLAEVEM